MASRGWHLVGYRLGGYRFEQGEPGAWIYRIELLPADPRSAASQEYLTLLLDSRRGGGQHACAMGLPAPAGGTGTLRALLRPRVAHRALPARPQAADVGARHPGVLRRRLVRGLRRIGRTRLPDPDGDPCARPGRARPAGRASIAPGESGSRRSAWSTSNAGACTGSGAGAERDGTRRQAAAAGW